MCHLATWIIDKKIDEHHGKLFKFWYGGSRDTVRRTYCINAIKSQGSPCYEQTPRDRRFGLYSKINCPHLLNCVSLLNRSSMTTRYHIHLIGVRFSTANLSSKSDMLYRMWEVCKNVTILLPLVSTDWRLVGMVGSANQFVRKNAVSIEWYGCSIIIGERLNIHSVSRVWSM